MVNRELKFYSDAECTKQIPREKGETQLRFPKSPVGGEEVTVEYFIRNETKDIFTVTEVTSPHRTKIELASPKLFPYQAVKMTIKFKPEENSEVPLNESFKIKGYYTIEPEP